MKIDKVSESHYEIVDTDESTVVLDDSPSMVAYRKFYEKRRQKAMKWVDQKVKKWVKEGGNDTPTVRYDYMLTALSELAEFRDEEVWKTAWETALKTGIR